MRNRPSTEPAHPGRPALDDHEGPIREDASYDYGLDPGEDFAPEEDDEVFDLSRPHIMTVLGPIEPGALGFALHHEHLYRQTHPAVADDPDRQLDNPTAAREELELFFGAGGRAVVDMSSADRGRDAAVMLELAAHSAVHLLVVTGHHTDRFARPRIAGDDSATIAARTVHELSVGMDGTRVRAGLIAAASSLDVITDLEERILRAAARAALAAGAPISTHTEHGTVALEQIEILASEGMDPRRVILGHLDDRLPDLPYLREVCATGAFLSFDRWSRSTDVTDADRARAVAELADAGHLDQLLISGDLDRRSQQLAHGGQPGLAFFCDHVPLMLMEAGLDAPAVKRIFIDNPARALTIHRPIR